MRHIIGVPALAFALAACGGKKDDKPAPTPGSGSATGAAAKKYTLTLDWVPEPQFGGFYAAKETGAFAKQGLDIDIKPRGQGQTWKLVAEKATDFATTAADQVLIAREQGADVVAIFATYQTFPQGIMVHKARGFTKIDDVFASPGTLEAEDNTWLKFLLAKFPGSKVKLTSNSPGIATFLAKKDLSKQCFVTSEPLKAAAAGSDPQAFLIADAGYNPYVTVVIARGEMVRNDPATVDKMIVALREGWASYLADPAPANAVMGKLNREMDAATFAESAKIQKPLIETDETKAAGHLGLMTDARWQTLAQQLVDLAVITKAPPAQEVYTTRERLGGATGSAGSAVGSAAGSDSGSAAESDYTPKGGGEAPPSDKAKSSDPEEGGEAPAPNPSPPKPSTRGAKTKASSDPEEGGE